MEHTLELIAVILVISFAVVCYYLSHVTHQIADLGKGIASLNVYLERIDAALQARLK
jgi:hypothetical protein